MENNITREEIFYEVYEAFLDLLKKCNRDPNLSEFSASTEKQIEKFEDDFPEIVVEYYHFKK